MTAPLGYLRLLKARGSGWYGRGGPVTPPPPPPPAGTIRGAMTRAYGRSVFTPPPPPGGVPTNTRDNLTIGTYVPDATNTGLFGSPTLTLDLGSGGVRTYSDQSATVKVVQNITFRCRVSVTGKHYVFYNCVFEGDPLGGWECITTTSGTVEDILVKDCVFSPSTVWSNMCPIKGWNYTALRCDVSGVADGFNAQTPSTIGYASPNGTQNVRILGCYIHDLAMCSPDAGSAGGVVDNAGHVDAALQCRGGSNVELNGNNIQSFVVTTRGIGSAGEAMFTLAHPTDATKRWHITGLKYVGTNNSNVGISCLMYSPYLGTFWIDPKSGVGLRIRNNLMDGGAVALNLTSSSTTSTGIEIDNNTLGPIGQRDNPPTSPTLVLASISQAFASFTGNKLWNGTSYNVKSRGG